jgi:antitoxin PrlF
MSQKKSRTNASCDSGAKGGPSCCKESTCKIESIIMVDERGQMVLPKEIREKANIKAGDKLVLISWIRENKIICFNLMKSEELGFFVKDFIGPIMQESSEKK